MTPDWKVYKRVMRSEFLIGDWTAVPSRNLLTRRNEEIRLEPRVMDVLVLLADHADRIVSKEELIEQVWKTRFVTDDVLTVTIYALRKALRDDARRPRYIETVSRRGYRLVAPVRIVRTGQCEKDRHATDQRAPRRYSGAAVAATAALASFAMAAVWLVAGARPARDVPSADAHEAYVKGRYFLDQRSTRGWQQALEQFERAAALDPRYPAAHAGLADTYSAMSDFGVASPAEMRPRAMQMAGRALDLDSRSGRYGDARKEVDRARQLNPQAVGAFLLEGWTFELEGQPDAAFAAYRRALRLSGAPEESLQRVDALYRAEGLPGYYRGWLNRPSPAGAPMSDTWRAQLYVRAGELDRAIESLEHAYQKREGALAWVNVEPGFEPLRPNTRFQQIAARVIHGQ